MLGWMIFLAFVIVMVVAAQIMNYRDARIERERIARQEEYLRKFRENMIIFEEDV